MWRIAALCVGTVLCAACAAGGAAGERDAEGTAGGRDGRADPDSDFGGTYMWWPSFAEAPRDCESIDATLAAARARWDAAGPDSYRFRFTLLAQIGAGQWDGIVLDGAPAGWLGGDVAGFTPSLIRLDTVPALFDHIAGLCRLANEHPEERCGSELEVDAALGYPLLFRYDCAGIDEEEELRMLAFGAPDTPLATACQAAVDRLVALYEEAGEPPAHLVAEEGPDAYDPPLDGSELDVMRVFQALDRLSMEDGWVLDWVYHFDGGAGMPLLYARRADAPRFLRESEYMVAYGDLATRDALHPFAHLTVDGSDEAWCQLDMFFAMSSQFYLWWHAHYDDTRLVFTRAALERILRPEREPICPEWFTAEQEAAARAIDLTPEVTPVADAEPGVDVVLVRAVWFGKWGGFSVRATPFRAAFPHDYGVRAGSSEEPVPYHCGVVF